MIYNDILYSIIYILVSGNQHQDIPNIIKNKEYSYAGLRRYET